MKIRQQIDPDIEIKLDKNWLPKASSSGKEEALGHQGRSSIGDDDLHLPLNGAQFGGNQQFLNPS
jgi:hypothetical protein